jgi:hypothetical protein
MPVKWKCPGCDRYAFGEPRAFCGFCVTAAVGLVQEFLSRRPRPDVREFFDEKLGAPGRDILMAMLISEGLKQERAELG